MMTTQTGPRPHRRGEPHRDQHGNLIENYHLCGCQPFGDPVDAERLARAIQADIARRRPLESGQRFRDEYARLTESRLTESRPTDGDDRV